MTRKAALISILTLCLASYLAVAADTTIDTTPFWNGIDYVHYFGYAGIQTATYGQIVTVPTGPNTVLKSFSFFMDQNTTVNFRGEVYEWDATNTMAIGPDLWEGAPMHTTNPDVFQQIDFVTGGVPLVAGNQYVVFATTIKDSGTGNGVWGYPLDDAYGGGAFAFLNNSIPTDPSQWTTDTWSTDWDGTGFDLAFKADFGPLGPQVPEPATMALFALGIAGVVARRKKR